MIDMILGIIAGIIVLWLFIRWEVRRSITNILSELYDRGLIDMDKEKFKRYQEEKRKKFYSPSKINVST